MVEAIVCQTGADFDHAGEKYCALRRGVNDRVHRI
jgi:hypothetical protein